ncbi:MAG: hypothetical protein AAF557_19865 [Pseudomonadota bacterium]
MPIRFAALVVALALGACTGEQFSQGVAGFVVGATAESIGAAISGEDVVPAAVDGGFAGAADAAYPRGEETDLKVLLTEETW